MKKTNPCADFPQAGLSGDHSPYLSSSSGFLASDLAVWVTSSLTGKCAAKRGCKNDGHGTRGGKETENTNSVFGGCGAGAGAGVVRRTAERDAVGKPGGRGRAACPNGSPCLRRHAAIAAGKSFRIAGAFGYAGVLRAAQAASGRSVRRHDVHEARRPGSRG